MFWVNDLVWFECIFTPAFRNVGSFLGDSEGTYGKWRRSGGGGGCGWWLVASAAAMTAVKVDMEESPMTT